MDNTAHLRRRNVVDIKVDTLRELVRLGLTVLVTQGKHLPPINATVDIEAAVAVVYAREGFCRVCIGLGARTHTAAILLGECLMVDGSDFTGQVTAAYCGLGGLPATVGWQVMVNGRRFLTVLLFAIPPKTRLHTFQEVANGIQLFNEGMIEVAPYQRRDEHGNEHAGILGPLPGQIPLLPPRWKKALAAPRLKAGGKWFAFGSVDEAQRLRIAATALKKAHELVAELLPGGSTVGPEYVAKNPNRDDRRPGSFRINLASGAWADFALPGIKGQDLISLTGYVRTCDYAVAAAWLSTRFN